MDQPIEVAFANSLVVIDIETDDIGIRMNCGCQKIDVEVVDEIITIEVRQRAEQKLNLTRCWRTHVPGKTMASRKEWTVAVQRRSIQAELFWPAGLAIVVHSVDEEMRRVCVVGRLVSSCELPPPSACFSFLEKNYIKPYGVDFLMVYRKDFT